MAITAAVIAAAGAVGGGILSSQNQPQGSGGAGVPSGLGTATQTIPQNTAILGAPNVGNPNPVFGQFLQGF